MVTPLIVHVCIEFHVVSTFTPQIVRLHFGVRVIPMLAISHGCHAFRMLSVVLRKLQCFILKYIFEVLPGSRLLLCAETKTRLAPSA